MQPTTLPTRRNFIRGVGAAIALPSLVSMAPRVLQASPELETAKLAQSASGAPLRSAFLYFPNGSIPSAWWPETTGNEFRLSETLETLAPVRNSIQILGGLDSESAKPGRDGAGDHARGGGTFLTGVRLKKSATDIRAGISIDQVIAEKVGHLTRFPSLELSCESSRQTGSCDSGYSCAYQYNISWKSPTTPMAPEANPRLVFERLFGAGRPDQRVSNLQQRRAQQRSVLDFVLDDATRMRNRLQQSDRQKLDEYLSSVREIETRIQSAERLGDAETSAAAPAGIPPTYQAHVELMFDLLLLAFQTDSTRVASMCLAHDGSNRSFSDIGIVEGHHELTHHQNDQDKINKIKKIDRWYVQQLSQFLQKMNDTQDVDDQSLLHNSMIMFGSGNADANRHTHVNLPVILAGAGGGALQTGRYVDYKATPLTNMQLTMAHQMGLEDVPRFGDSTGVISDV